MIPIRLDGDKSIAHRALILSSIINGPSEIYNAPDCDDIYSTISCLLSLGIEVEKDNKSIKVVGGKFNNDIEINVGESGTTARLMAGLIAGLGIRSSIVCSGSLKSRPMARIISPLQKMGASIESSNNLLPIRVLKGISSGGSYSPKVASAQVKSSLSFAALASGYDITINEVAETRDHLERLLSTISPDAIKISDKTISVFGSRFCIDRLSISVPGDISSASFIILASLYFNRSIKIKGVLTNRRRTGFIEIAKKMGANISIYNEKMLYGEMYGDIEVKKSRLRSIDIDKGDIAAIIDEIPAIAILALRAEGATTIRGAEELRVKESDRINSIVQNMKSFGARVKEYSDGFSVESSKLYNTTISTFSDHRIAMAFYILSRSLGSSPVLDNPGCINKSYPSFVHDIERILSE